MMPAPYPRSFLTHRLENISLAHQQKIFLFISGGLDQLSMFLRLDHSVRFLINFICGGEFLLQLTRRVNIYRDYVCDGHGSIFG